MSTADRPATEPRTEAGRRLLAMLPDYSAGAKTNRWQEHVQKYADAILAIEAEAAQGAAPLPHEHHWVGPDNFSPVDYCGICSVARPHQHHVHDKRRVTDCPECIEAATAFLSEGAAPRAEGLDVERLVADIEAIDHPCHDVCIGNLHADCQCAAWIRQEVLLLLSRPSDERVPESEESR